MDFDITPAAAHGAVTFAPAGGSTANGTCTVENVYEHSTMNDSFDVTCTAVDATGATFTVTSGVSGTDTGKVGPVAGNTVTITVAKNGDNTVQVKITQGTNPFVVGDKFGFPTTFNYSEYRGSLAEPDCQHGGGVQGRSVATLTHGYTFTLE